MPSLAEYLAKNYLTADPPPDQPKKKRKKTKTKTSAEEPTGLIIADDDPTDLRTPATATGTGNPEDEETPSLVTNTRSAEFRKAKKSNWKTIGGGTTTPATSTSANTGTTTAATTTTNNASEQDSADAIIASAAAEGAARRGENEDEDAPAVVEGVENNNNNNNDTKTPRMQSGARAGLQTAAQTAEMVAEQARAREAEAARYKEKSKTSTNPQTALAQETIYRDASGRIINVAMKRAEARRAEQEKAEKEERAREGLMGDVQRREREERKEELREARTMPVARTAEDEGLNEELRGRQRWDDPALQFLSNAGGGGVGGSGLSRTGKPLYRGSYQPNRYGIRPGHRWDGVDRGIGFEKEWFASRNRKGRMEAMEYEWQIDE